ncbi:MAG: mandelate racemase/muconate lactonizing enzyme family protein [Thermodesulfobacteriota bacterium]|nr:mandelate racemase/muconate lactonizing enzyme family protein [Thermodesulfobacteriota bacterium]
MKIEKIEIFSIRVPLKRAAESAHGLATEQDSVIAKISTASGGYGIGAAEPLPGYDEESKDEILTTLQNHLIPKIIGESPFQIRRILELMDAEISGHLGSKAIIEMALFDLLGKMLGVPVYTFFGGKVKDLIQLNGWVGLVTPEEAKREAQDLLDKGFRSLKVKINPDVAAGKRRVEAVRSVVKDKIQIRVDANESLDLKQAEEAAIALKPLDILYLEQPFPRNSFEDFVTFSRMSPVKLMADESIHDMESLLHILKSGSTQFVKVKVQKMGGLLKTYQAVQVAEAFGIPVILGHGFGLTVNTLAELHLAASTNAILDGCEAVGPFKMADDVVIKPLFMDKGFIPVSNKPGLGADLDEEKLKKYLVK